MSDITCTFTAINALDPLGGGGADVDNPNSLPEGTQSWRSCFNTKTGARVEGPTLYTTPAGGGAAPRVTPELIEMALANIDIDLPVPTFSPPGQTFPNFDTWFWTNELPTQRASASAGGVTITARAELVSTKFEINPSPTAASSDDHVVVTCPGAPKAYDSAKADAAQKSSCTHRFAAPTRDLTIDTTATWHLTWTATNGTTGDLGTIDRTTTTPYRVQEKRTVIRSGT